MNAPVDTTRERTCIRCHGQFTERAGTVTRICDRCRHRGVDVSDDTHGTIVDQRRERTCVRCETPFLEGVGEISRLCPACDSEHLFLG